MAVTCVNFKKYPIEILGIDATYNEELTAIETFVKSEIEYSGKIADIESVLPYFIFFKYFENKHSETTVKGETAVVAEHTVPSYDIQIRAWNIGAGLLKNICLAKGTTASKKYLSKIGLLC